MKGIAVYYLLDPRDNHLNPISGQHSYVGITKNPKNRLRAHSRKNLVRHTSCWVRKLINEGVKPILRIVCWANDNDEACYYEIELIKRLRKKGVVLTNETSGGEGCYDLSVDARFKISQKVTGLTPWTKGRKLSIEHRKNIGDAHRGKPKTYRPWNLGKRMIMKLSEAIRLGAMIRPQGFGRYYDRDTNGSCALGAAYEAIGQNIIGNRTLTEVSTPQEWDWARRKAWSNTISNGIPVECPACFSYPWVSYGNIIPHLNDWHHWTREQIADWVASVEPKDVPEPVVVAEESAPCLV